MEKNPYLIITIGQNGMGFIVVWVILQAFHCLQSLTDHRSHILGLKNLQASKNDANYRIFSGFIKDIADGGVAALRNGAGGGAGRRIGKVGAFGGGGRIDARAFSFSLCGGGMASFIFSLSVSQTVGTLDVSDSTGVHS